jgi:UDP-N-acetylglucosamine 1-carboxyvinyltransferase
MKKILIRGGNKLFGSVDIFGAKNASLPIMVASLLTDEPLTLSNLPHVSDISSMINLLANLGVKIHFSGDEKDRGNQARVASFIAKDVKNFTAEYDIVRKMRASILVLGPLLARFGEAKISLPGGCAIGARPIDLHLKALEKLGAKIEILNGFVRASVDGRLVGAEINFEKVSVGATENILMASVLARGETAINNAACEPEITDLAKCLTSMGAKITGAGSPRIKVVGVDKLHFASHRIISDRIEAGTYAVAAGITDGCIKLRNVDISLFTGFKSALEEAGVALTDLGGGEIEVKRSGKNIKPINISTNPFPGFPTDMQAQFMSLMSIAERSCGISEIKENIFENRFMHSSELARMGANIDLFGNIAIVKPVKNLNGAEVMATDLRASVSLVLAGLVADGETKISRIYHLERGYEMLTDKLSACGADIKLIA